MKSAVFFGLLVFCLTVGATMSAPAPYPDDKDILSNSETRNYGFPFYWFVRPVYEDEDDYAGNGGPSLNLNRRTSTVSLVAVGSGWGR